MPVTVKAMTGSGINEVNTSSNKNIGVENEFLMFKKM